MSIFPKKRKFQLPKFPDTIIPTFKALCEVCSSEQVTELHNMLVVAEEDIRKDVNQGEQIDIDSALEIIKVCNYLLNSYDQFSNQHKALIVGAVRYFLADDDPVNDTYFACGFFDDRRIINYVLEELGEESRYLSED